MESAEDIVINVYGQGYKLNAKIEIFEDVIISSRSKIHKIKIIQYLILLFLVLALIVVVINYSINNKSNVDLLDAESKKSITAIVNNLIHNQKGCSNGDMAFLLSSKGNFSIPITRIQKKCSFT